MSFEGWVWRADYGGWFCSGIYLESKGAFSRVFLGVFRRQGGTSAFGEKPFARKVCVTVFEKPGRMGPPGIYD